MTVLYLQREQVLHAAPPCFYSYRSLEGTNQTATFAVDTVEEGEGIAAFSWI